MISTAKLKKLEEQLVLKDALLPERDKRFTDLKEITQLLKAKYKV